MKLFPQLTKVSAAVWLFTIPLAAQNYRLDSIRYDSFGGLVTLGWQSQAGGIYSFESTTNLTDWEEIRLSGQPIRLPAAGGSRSQIELEVPPGKQRFWRVRKTAITDVGTIPGISANAVLLDVNDSGRVVGRFEAAGGQYGFTWAPGEELVSFGERSYATAVNQSGMVVGTRYGAGKFFSWSKSGGVVELGDGLAVDINVAGDILGRDGSGAFLWKPRRGKIRIPDLSTTEPYTVPEALSDAGHVVGASLIDGNYYRAFLWTESGGLVDLTASLSSAASGVMDVNSSGQVVGHRVVAGGATRAFSWTAAGGFVTFPPGCYITDVSENGTVIGRGYLVGNSDKAFSWTEKGGIVDLGDGMPEQVNELGQIVGTAIGLAGAPVAVLWSPMGDRTELEALSTLGSGANLISNNGVVFGFCRIPGAAAARVVMWTTN